jgi:hypothetical protein
VNCWCTQMLFPLMVLVILIVVPAKVSITGRLIPWAVWQAEWFQQCCLCI